MIEPAFCDLRISDYITKSPISASALIMNARICIIAIALWQCALGHAQCEEELASRKKAWNQWLQDVPFKIDEKFVGIIRYMRNFSGDYQLQIICNPPSARSFPGTNELVTFRCVRDGKELISLDGHLESAFISLDGKFYFASYGPNAAGCKLLAYDMSDGHVLWKTEDLRQFGQMPHSGYGNRVIIGLSRKNSTVWEKIGAPNGLSGRLAAVSLRRLIPLLRGN